MLLQFPILMALFMFVPSAIELRQQSFLWADDLSTYDAFITFPFHIPFLHDSQNQQYDTHAQAPTG